MSLELEEIYSPSFKAAQYERDVRFSTTFREPICCVDSLEFFRRISNTKLCFSGKLFMDVQKHKFYAPIYRHSPMLISAKIRGSFRSREPEERIVVSDTLGGHVYFTRPWISDSVMEIHNDLPSDRKFHPKILRSKGYKDLYKFRGSFLFTPSPPPKERDNCWKEEILP